MEKNTERFCQLDKKENVHLSKHIVLAEPRSSYLICDQMLAYSHHVSHRTLERNCDLYCLDQAYLE